MTDIPHWDKWSEARQENYHLRQLVFNWAAKVKYTKLKHLKIEVENIFLKNIMILVTEKEYK